MKVQNLCGILEVINGISGAVALNHIICTKGAWNPLGGVGLRSLVYLVGAETVCAR